VSRCASAHSLTPKALECSRDLAAACCPARRPGRFVLASCHRSATCCLDLVWHRAQLDRCWSLSGEKGSLASWVRALVVWVWGRRSVRRLQSPLPRAWAGERERVLGVGGWCSCVVMTGRTGRCDCREKREGGHPWRRLLENGRRCPVGGMSVYINMGELRRFKLRDIRMTGDMSRTTRERC
jgi:hypothetical protein